MTVAKLQLYLDELLAENRKFDAQVVANFKKKAEDWFWVSEDEWKFLAQKILDEHGDRFVDEATRRDLARYLVEKVKSKGTPWQPFLEFLSSIPGLANLLVEANLGQWRQIFSDGMASPEEIRAARQKAQDFHGKVSLAKIDPHNDEVAEIEAAIAKTIAAIDGFAFLSQPPRGKAANEHVILVKVGVNWGLFGYPTVSSWESVYVMTKLCLKEAANQGAAAQVIVGDESGIEIKLWGGKTMDNFETTGILRAAILAGLEHAASLEGAEPAKFAGAGQLLAEARAGQVTRASVKMLEMAQLAGVRVVPFDEGEHQLINVPDSRHFRDGIRVPRVVAAEVTDIINLPKPPGRHLIMGNTGLTGALKNHVGLLASDQRSPGLHGPYDRYPPKAADQTEAVYLENLQARRRAIQVDGSGKEARRFALDVMFNWGNFAPGMAFQEKIVELYLAVKDKERFSVTDMRRTMSSLGPDLGDTVAIGAVLAATDPLSLDVMAGALLKVAYDGMGDALAALAPGGDTLLEYLVGKTWLKSGTPFDLLSHIAANSYGIGPVDLAHLEIKGMEHGGFSAQEMAAITAVLKG